MVAQKVELKVKMKGIQLVVEKVEKMVAWKASSMDDLMVD